VKGKYDGRVIFFNSYFPSIILREFRHIPPHRRAARSACQE
jgi:hypothetical protein